MLLAMSATEMREPRRASMNSSIHRRHVPENRLAPSGPGASSDGVRLNRDLECNTSRSP
jgi:hypothetical protein